MRRSGSSSTRTIEHQEQAAVIAWAAYQQRRYPELGLLYAIPNGGWRHISTARKLKAEGVRAGVPDLCLPVARGGYHGLYIEMKAPGGRASTSQKMWLKALNEQGYRAVVVHGADEAIAVITKYMAGG